MDNKSFVLGIALGAIALGVVFTTTMKGPGQQIARTPEQMEVSQQEMGEEFADMGDGMDPSFLAAQIDPTGPVTQPPPPSGAFSASASSRSTSSLNSSNSRSNSSVYSSESWLSSSASRSSSLNSSNSRSNSSVYSSESWLSSSASQPSSAASSSPSCNPTQPYNVEFLSINAPSEVSRGTPYSAEVRVRNTGSESWAFWNGVRLGTVSPWNHHTWTVNRADIRTPGDGAYVVVYPCQEFTFDFVFAPAVDPGTYSFQWRMLRENINFFGKNSPKLMITVR